ncbi:MAG TPA: tRNA dihydrouridine synthase DusB [Chitinispirillaceae bacterium]|nr:tRNA dihydrouridine synthase DusB [Chitinispirillaceae bacterium]
MEIKKNSLLLAPMAGITEPVFRGICREFGADIVVSEMVSAEGILYGSKPTIDLIMFEPSQRPIGIQLFGGNPDHLARAAAFVESKVSPDFIDLNAGCPVQKVVKKNGGSSLLKDLNNFGAIVRSMVNAVSTPVTVKLRSGIHKYQWVDIEFAQMAQDCGAAAVTLHPRSQSMMFSGHSFWERIAEVKKAISIPVIGNGDICIADDALQMIAQTNCDSVMIGRGAYGNPWLFKQIKDAMSGAPVTEAALPERLTVALDHLQRYRDHYGDSAAGREMKKHAAWYCKGIANAAVLRNEIFRCNRAEELRGILMRAMDTVTM